MPGRDTVDFDHIIVGAGLSGLLWQIPSWTRRVRRLLVVDPRPADDRSVTYAYWSTRPTILDRWAVGSWNRLKAVDRRGQETSATLNAARYVAVSWNRARAELFGKVSQDSRVTLLQQAVDLVWTEPIVVACASVTQSSPADGSMTAVRPGCLWSRSRSGHAYGAGFPAAYGSEPQAR